MRTHRHIWFLLILLIPGEHFSEKILLEELQARTELCGIEAENFSIQSVGGQIEVCSSE